MVEFKAERLGQSSCGFGETGMESADFTEVRVFASLKPRRVSFIF
jgi:hypothetical protein